MKKIKFKIEGMHCSSCAMLIDMELEDLEGVNTSKTNYAKAETEVEFDSSKVEVSKLIEAIKKVGYIASPLDPD